MRRTRSSLAAMVLLLAGVTGCGSARSSSPATQASAPSSTAGVGSGTNVAAPEALAFTASLVNGGPIDLRTLSGKPVVFWFWAPT